MNDDTMERTLRETLTAVAASTRLEDRWSEIAAAPTPARREHRPLFVVAAAFVVVLVTVGSFALVSTLINSDRDVAEPPADPAASSGLRYPVLRYVPSGVDQVWAQIPVRDPGWPSVVTAVVGRRTFFGEGGTVPDIDEIAAVHVRRAVPDDATAEGELLSVGDRDVVLLPEGSFAGSATLTWTEGDVTGIVYVSDGDVDRGLAVVEGVRWTGDDPTAPGAVVVDPPEGLELIADPTVTSDESGPMVSMEWGDAGPPMTVAGEEPPVVTAMQADVSVFADSPEIMLAPHPVAQSFELRGRHAYLVWHRQFSAVIWEEEPGTTVQVSGSGMNSAELIRIAEDLELTDEESWRSLYDVFDPGRVTPTTKGG